MYIKKPLYHVLIRVGILILLLIGIFIYTYLTYDSHQVIRHVDPIVGYYILGFILTQVFCLFLLLEIIYLVEKKKKNLALINLTFISVIELSFFVYIYCLYILRV
jgi:hypothetical protein